jgi:hypothetical protein
MAGLPADRGTAAFGVVTRATLLPAPLEALLVLLGLGALVLVLPRRRRLAEQPG